MDAYSRREMMAIALQLDGRSEHRSTRLRIAVDSMGITRLTSRGHVLRMQRWTREGNHSTAVGLGSNVEQFDIRIVRYIEVGSVPFRNGRCYHFREFDIRSLP
jgi:hypothetical protein